MIDDLPEQVRQVFERGLTCEVTTVAKSGPVTFPLMALWKPGRGEFDLVTGIGLPRKLYNIQRDDRVSLLFSEFAGSGLHSPPAVLVQGRGRVPDEVLGVAGLEDFWEEFFRRKPNAIDALALNPAAQQAVPPGFLWRVRITVTPERVWVYHRDPSGEQTLERVA